jgi:tetratricopeptide (TPR) repeat protein
MKETELEAKFGKLKKQFPIHHVAVIAAMEDLANIYHALEKCKKAERLYRSLVDVYRRTSGPTNLKTLLACQKVIESIMDQGRWPEAQSLNQNLRSTIFKFVSPNHALAIWARWADGCLALSLGQEKRAEILSREHLQIRLSLYGPRHTYTIHAMRQLIYSIARRGMGEAEKLARFAVQLCLENPPADEEACSAMSVLAKTLHRSSRYVESCSIAKNAIEKFSDSLGLDHPVLLAVQSDLSWSMLKAGKLAESEGRFRDLHLRYPQNERRTVEPLNIWSGLAAVLKEQGKVDEATTWYEKSFQAKLASYGACSSITVNSCGCLRFCYEKQGRYDDVLQLYRKMISSIKDTTMDRNDEDPNELIAKVEGWIEEVLK